MKSARALGIGLIVCLAGSCAGVAKPARFDAAGDPLPAQALHRFGTARFCTQAEVVSLVLSHDGKLLAAADRQGRVYLWDTDTGKKRFVTRPDSGKRVALSPDGQWLALGEDAPFEVRNLKKTEPPHLPIGNAPRVFAFSPDSKSIAIALTDESDIVLYDLVDGKEVRRYAGFEGPLSALAFSHDGKYLACGGVPKVDMDKPFVRFVVWDALKGKELKIIDSAGKEVRGLAFLPDNKTIVAQIGARLAGWNALSGERIEKIRHDVGSSFALDKAGKVLATIDGPKVVELDTGKELHDFDSPALLRHVALSGDGKLLAACPARFDSSSPRILLWDLPAGKERIPPAAHRHYVDAVAFSQDGQKIATASNLENAARIWDARDAKLWHVLNLDSVAGKKSGGPHSRRTLVDALAFSVDRSELFVAGQRWDVTTGKAIPMEADDDFRFDQANSQRAVMAPDGRLAATFLNRSEIWFWDPAKARTIQKINTADKKSYGESFALAFTPDNKFAAVGKWFPPIRSDMDVLLEDTIQVWDIAASKRVKSFRASRTPVVRLMFSPDGETLAVVGFPARLELWHLPTARLLREMSLAEFDEPPRTFSLSSVAFSPHGHWIALTHQEREIALIETITGKEILSLRGHEGYISSVAFSPDCRRLLSGGRDTTALLWSVPPEKPALPPAWDDTEKLWQALGGPTEPAYRVIWALMAHPDRAIDVLSNRLKPDDGVSEKEIVELVRNLASPKFAQRDVAIRPLKEIGTRALPTLEAALKKSPDLETTRRINELLKTVETSLTPETLRDLRGLQILEMIASSEARALLIQIAKGDRGAAKTRHAQAALERLKR